ncbi:gas vesicle protein GvpL/GvpF [Nocardioides sp. J9]|uniref:GvpL/GvpF family gas vesicle protein n=1 Tax=Nocardioides sp. J9 TaxID=935844 RepID=UPI0011A1D4F5|nr:GvpL/GvpF family gas vesicle protein [Nocardioides sp. J9]TWG90182.1 gas vesicle protein GvpL/GvpF [Nocardioides sp. J9]
MGARLAPAPPGVQAEDADLVVFGVVPAGDDADDVGGAVDDPDVGLVVGDGVAAVVAPVRAGFSRPRRADLLRHHAVLDALVASGAVAPVRFGTVLPDEAAVAGFLAEQRDPLRAVLERLAGRRQHNLRVEHVEEAVLADLVARDQEVRRLRERTRDLPEEASYRDRVRLGELVAHALEQRSAEAAVVVLDAIAGLAEVRVRREPSATQAVDAALLVDVEREQELVDRLEELAAEHHEVLRVRLVGPMAPYDFAGDVPWA